MVEKQKQDKALEASTESKKTTDDTIAIAIDIKWSTHIKMLRWESTTDYDNRCFGAKRPLITQDSKNLSYINNRKKKYETRMKKDQNTLRILAMQRWRLKKNLYLDVVL